jgi:hypothetical protein
MQAGRSDHIDQGNEAQQFDLAAHEIRDTRLGNAKQLGGFGLAQSGRYEARYCTGILVLPCSTGHGSK